MKAPRRKSCRELSRVFVAEGVVDSGRMRRDELLALARTIDPERAPSLESRFAHWGTALAEARALAMVVVAAFPAFGPLADARPAIFVNLASEGWRTPRTRRTLVASLSAYAGDLSDGDSVRARLRLAVQYEKVRIAVRELLPRSLDGADVDVTCGRNFGSRRSCSSRWRSMRRSITPPGGGVLL